ncbi:MAG: hypothetical protein OCD76_24900 [Reichenbachiella sp.]
MPTVPFKYSLKAIASRDPDFANNILEDAVNAMLTGNLDDGRIHLRDYINATIGFPELAKRTGKIDKNLMRSLSEKGNPTASNLFEIIQVCVEAEGVTIAAHVIASPKNDLVMR